MYILILAGGAGTRLWPVSRKNNPKQISELFSTETMIERTWKRLRHKFPARQIFICTSGKSAKFIKKVLPDLPRANLLIEPFAHGTAAAIGYSVAQIFAKYGNVPIFVASSDHHIQDEKAYLETLHRVEQTLKKHPTKTVLVGVKPTYAETGYGYIKIRNPKSEIRNKSQIQNPKSQIFEIDKFIEKPSLEKARGYLKLGNYLWNAGMFGWTSGHLLELYRKRLPKTYKILKSNLFPAKILKLNLFPERSRGVEIKKWYHRLDNTSIDYGILEKEKDVLVIPATFDWADIGHWRTVHEILRGHPDENVVRGQHVHIDSSGNLIYSTSDKLVATAGLRNMVIIETADAILVCPRDKTQDVKKITELLKKKKLLKYL